MDNCFYKDLILKSKIGYAYRRAVLNELGKPVDYQFVEVNDAFVELTGLKIEKVKGKLASEVLGELSDNSMEWIRFYGNIAINDGIGETEQLSHYDNKWYRVIVRGHGNLFFSTMFVDITSQKNVEAKLRESEKRFKTLHDASFGGIFIHKDMIILDCNSGLSEITGYPKNSLEGMNLLNLICPDYHPVVIEAVSLRSEGDYEVIGVKRSGEKYNLKVQAKNIPYNDDMARVVEFRDITKTKTMQRDIMAAQRDAELANDHKERFMSSMSHELKTPLNGMLGMLHLLETEDLSQEHLNYIEHFRKATMELYQRIDSLLNHQNKEKSQKHENNS